MKGNPSVFLLITGIVISFLSFSFVSITRSLFHIIKDHASANPSDLYLRHYYLKIEKILKNELLFSSTILAGRVLSQTFFSIFTYYFLTLKFPQLNNTDKIIIIFAATLLVIILIGHIIPEALIRKYFKPFIPFSYNLYQILGWFLTPYLLFIIWCYKTTLKVIHYDESISFMGNEKDKNLKKEADPFELKEKDMIRKILNLKKKTVEEIMVPRIDIKAIEVNTPFEEIIRIIDEEGHSRLPVYKDTIDSILGLLYAKDIILWLANHKKEEWDIMQLLKKPLYVPIGKRVNSLMNDFRKNHIHLAVVVDEYGGTAGVVTMEDIIEQIFGEIHDEYDEVEEEIIKIENNVYLVDPLIDIEELNSKLGCQIETNEEEYSTLSGLIYHKFGDIPKENSYFESGGARITVLEMEHQRIKKVKIEILGRIPEDTVYF
ncbi:MAG: hemolysin family protein [Chitinispirillaceae bacterium]|nr:hemolysin family protein [Chitinispirillaceae bacterium]